MRWPATWTEPNALSLLSGTGVNCLIFDQTPALQAVRAKAEEQGLKTASLDAPPAQVKVVEGAWPGVRMSGGASSDGGSAGPTGVPWVDSNQWITRLTSARHPETTVWIDAPAPEKARLSAGSYQVAVADVAACQGRWIITLDSLLAAGIAEQKADALKTWTSIAQAVKFFNARSEWSGYRPQAVAGVVSSFSGKGEFFSQEVLNLLSRANVHYRIILKDQVTGTSFEGLRAVLYSDEEPPAPGLQKQIMSYVQSGGMLITGPKWGQLPGAKPAPMRHPRFSSHLLGKGSVEVSKEDPSDPYLWANDASVLVSHRYDLVRFWNGGAYGSHYVRRADGQQGVVHLFFYGFRGPDSASVRVVGRYRTARIRTIDQAEPRPVKADFGKTSVEVYLPPAPQYVALELGA